MGIAGMTTTIECKRQNGFNARRRNPGKSQLCDKSRQKRGPCIRQRRPRQVKGSFQIPRSKSVSSRRVKAAYQASVHKANVNCSKLNSYIDKKKDSKCDKYVTLNARKRRLSKRAKVDKVTIGVPSSPDHSLPGKMFSTSYNIIPVCRQVSSKLIIFLQRE